MNSIPRHECIIYSGSPSEHLRSIALVLQRKLGEGCRCIYLNSPPMVAGMRSMLSAHDVDVAAAVAANRLILTSNQDHLVDGAFDTDRMLNMLRTALADALADGHTGLWASGDMAWEMGQSGDFSELVRYERLLEEFIEANPAMSGVCQYHTDTLPREVSQLGLRLHRSIHFDESLSPQNGHYVAPGSDLLEKH